MIGIKNTFSFISKLMKPRSIPMKGLLVDAGPGPFSSAVDASGDQEYLSVCDLPKGASSTIEGILSEGAIAAKLRALGFVSGTPLAVLSRSSWRGPIVVLVRGAKVALRFSEAQLVCVREHAANTRLRGAAN